MRRLKLWIGRRCDRIGRYDSIYEEATFGEFAIIALGALLLWWELHVSGAGQWKSVTAPRISAKMVSSTPIQDPADNGRNVPIADSCIATNDAHELA
jgi:hypothetical protein